jgi:hypothetical protein
MLCELATPARFRDALERLAVAEEDGWIDSARECMASRLCKAGLLEQASEAATGLMGFRRESVVRDIALAWVSQGDDDKALELIASSGIWEFGQGSIRSAIIDTILEARDLARAESLFEALPAADAYQAVPRYVGRLAALGFTDRALKLAREADSQTRGQALAAIAESLHAQLSDRVQQVAEEALQAFDGREADHTLSVIRLQILAGRRAEALEFSRSIRGPRDDKLADVVSLLVDIGEVDDAESLTEAIDNQYVKKDVRAAFVAGLVKTGDIERARRFADGLNRFDKAAVKEDIVQSIAEGAPHLINVAIRIASEIAEDSYRGEALAHCIVSLVANGPFEMIPGVLDLLGEVKDEIYRGRSLEMSLRNAKPDPATLNRLIDMVRSLSARYRGEPLGAAAAAWHQLGHEAESRSVAREQPPVTRSTDKTTGAGVRGLRLLDEGLDAISQSTWREKDVYETLALGAAALSSLSDGLTLLAVYDAAVELDEWWPQTSY